VKLAKYGYNPERKVENKLKNHAIFLPHHGTYCPYMMIFLKKFKKILEIWPFWHFILKNSFYECIEFCFLLPRDEYPLKKKSCLREKKN
jgi:hypothetical protein